jgi:hypothetical protein
MSDHGRYDYNITTGRRSYGESGQDRGGGFSRNSGSMFRGPHGGDRHAREDRSFEGGRSSRGTTVYSGGREWRIEEQGEENRGGRWSFGGGERHRDEQRAPALEGGGSMFARSREGRENLDRDEYRSDRPSYGRDDERGGLPIEETSRLIASNKVEGTAVYGRDGHRLGNIYNFMVDKRSGKVEYAVMTYGGMLGMGQRYYPLPWEILTYDTRERGYRIEMTERDLRDAPSFDRDTEPHFDGSYNDHVHSWYGTGRR